MVKSPDYIPHRDSDFDYWFRNLTQYVAVKTQGSDAPWKDIPRENLEVFIDSYRIWFAAYSPTLKTHTAPETKAKNLAKGAATAIIRPFVQQFLMFPPVTDQDRLAMGLPMRDKKMSPIERPRQAPLLKVKLLEPRMLRLLLLSADTGRRAKPLGVAGAFISWAILDHPPMSIRELTSSDTSTKAFFDFFFDEEVRGKRLYIAVCWVNTKAEKGPFSNIEMAIIP